jgi:hypothetical protein
MATGADYHRDSAEREGSDLRDACRNRPDAAQRIDMAHTEPTTGSERRSDRCGGRTTRDRVVTEKGDINPDDPSAPTVPIGLRDKLRIQALIHIRRTVDHIASADGRCRREE